MDSAHCNGHLLAGDADCVSSIATSQYPYSQPSLPRTPVNTVTLFILGLLKLCWLAKDTCTCAAIVHSVILLLLYTVKAW